MSRQMSKRRSVFAALFTGICLSFSAGVIANQGKKLSCNNYSPLETMFSDVCWEGMFPLRISGAAYREGKSGMPQGAVTEAVCACGGDMSEGQLPKLGIALGMWMPSKIIDVTRKPYCYASLNGMELPLGKVDALSSGANRGRSDRNEAFANWVMYSSPLVFMLKMLDEGACPSEGLTEFDVFQASPLLPTHNDVTGRYTFFLNPEMVLLANPVAMMAMFPDAIASAAGRPINSLFWVAGAWGPLYPMTGFHGSGNMADPVGFTSLIGARALGILHRLGFMKETIGHESMCERQRRFIFRKDGVRWQMLAPSPEKDGPRTTTPTTPTSTASTSTTGNDRVSEVSPRTKNQTCTHSTGAPTPGWGVWRDVPATGEDHSYMLFQWTDCCFGFTL